MRVLIYRSLILIASFFLISCYDQDCKNDFTEYQKEQLSVLDSLYKTDFFDKFYNSKWSSFGKSSIIKYDRNIFRLSISDSYGKTTLYKIEEIVGNYYLTVIEAKNDLNEQNELIQTYNLISNKTITKSKWEKLNQILNKHQFWTYVIEKDNRLLIHSTTILIEGHRINAKGCYSNNYHIIVAQSPKDPMFIEMYEAIKNLEN